MRHVGAHPPRCMHVLAGDVGGTNTRLSIWEAGAREPTFARTRPSRTVASLGDALATFLDEARRERADLHPIDRACVGIAGIVEDGVCRTANLPWVVDRRQLIERSGIERLELVNDFVALAAAVPALEEADVVSFGGHAREPRGPIAVVGPGTGLGEAFLLWSEGESEYRVVPSEGGHADFAPRTPLEMAFGRYLGLRYGRVSKERVLSGQGLVDAFHFLAEEEAVRRLVRPQTLAAVAVAEPAGVITGHAIDGSDPVCAIAVGLFASVLGAVAGNLALTVLATGGVFVGGGIAPRLIPFLRDSAFRESFDQKGRRRELLERIPLAVIVREEPGLLGAATIAAQR